MENMTHEEKIQLIHALLRILETPSVSLNKTLINTAETKLQKLVESI